MKHLAERTGCAVILRSPREADTEESLFTDLEGRDLVLCLAVVVDCFRHQKRIKNVTPVIPSEARNLLLP